MPVINRQDASDVEQHIDRIFRADSPEDRVREIRRLFVETLDFEQSSGVVSLEGAPASVELPATAHQIATLEEAHVVYVHLDTSRVRKAEASEAARLVSNQLGGDILMVFTNDESSQLHLIYPTFEGVRPTLRRMVIERDLPRRTAVMQVSNIFHEWERTGSIHLALESAFDVEAVTREFFKEYKRVFDAALDNIGGFCTDEPEQEAKKLFTQTLFNRLMFVYFVSRKGWLSFGGDRDYLGALWRDYVANASGSEGEPNFRYDRLRPLFFGGLNNDGSQDLTDYPDARRLIGKVPFLNGGLFEETYLDRRTDVAVPDAVIRSIFDDLFDRFNFTVMESTPFDIEVAVDPEMLGKVFEELVTGRHDSGSYYTPRPVVSFMCRESLKGFLQGRDTGLEDAAIARFVDDHDTSRVSVAAARSVGRALDEITVVDPACGSGAYLLGMMQELVELQTALYNAGLDAKSLYDLKLQIIERNLFGADIDEFAVNIAMLRLWLSLAIEYDAPGDPPPLPNLDFKIVCGDSLLGPCPDPSELNREFAEHVAKVLGERKSEFMRSTDGTRKDDLKSEIASRKREYAEWLEDSSSEDELDWRIEFAEVFALRGGFDIAVANPPYIQLQRDGGRLGRLYNDAGFVTYVRSGDIYQLFYERGCQILRPNRGLLAYITSNSWLKAEYGKSTRRFFSERHTPLRLLELGKDVFDGAIVDSGVLLLRTGEQNGAFPAVDMDRLPNASFPPDESLWGQVRPSGEEPWSILSRLEQGIMDKMRVRGTPLSDWDVTIYRGVTTGFNDAFIIDDATRMVLVAKDPNSADIIKPILRGRDIKRYRANWARKWLITTFPSVRVSIDDYPAVRKHLLSFGEDRLGQVGARLPNGGRSRKKTKHSWFELQDATTYYREFAKEKVFWMDLTDQGRFSYHENEIFCGDTAFMMNGVSLKYLCAVLNSSVMTWCMKSASLTSGMGTTRWKRFAVERLPIPKISAVEQRPFIRLVDEILEAKSADPDADTSYLEWDMDRLVYDLYGLTEEEDTAIERSLGLIHQTDEEEDAALVKWIQEGRTGEYVSKEVVMETLRSPDGG